VVWTGTGLLLVATIWLAVLGSRSADESGSLTDADEPKRPDWNAQIENAELDGTATTGKDPDGGVTPGVPITVLDPIALEVHPAISPGGRPGRLSALPPYIRRAHDEELAYLIHSAIAGRSQVVVLVGESSTGKTRACWEAVQGLPDDWRLWHPIDPGRLRAAVDSLSKVGPRTVVWLNELQHYLLAEDTNATEAIAAGLRSLLADAARGPVLVLGTTWPEFWKILTDTPPPGRPQRRSQARELLSSATSIVVPDAFGSDEIHVLHRLAAQDWRLDAAATQARDGRVTQFLAAVPRIIEIYRTAPAIARGLLDAAIDSRRFGHHDTAISAELLREATPGYLSDDQWQLADETWFDDAVAYASTPCFGAPGPLLPLRASPGSTESPSARPAYRLSDALERIGRMERAGVLPPESLWKALLHSDQQSIRWTADRYHQHIQRWLKVRAKGERASALTEHLAVEFIDSAGRMADPGANAGAFRAYYTMDQAGQWHPPSYRIRLRNTGDRPVYCTILDLTDSWASRDDLLPPTLVQAGAGAMALDGNLIVITLPAGRPIVPGSLARDKLVILASTQPFRTDGLTMGPLDSPATRGLAAAVPVGLGDGDAEWGGRTIDVVTSVPVV
jgi:hypothetical protein